MINAFRFLSLRHLTSKPSRYLLTALGVACGVALYLAVALINRATLNSFRETVESLTGKAQLTVLGPESGFEEGLSEELRDVEGVKSAVPMVETRAWFTGGDGQQRSLAILGIDLLQESAVRSYESRGQDVIDDPLVFLNNPDSVVLTTRFAAEHGLKLDSRFKLSTAFGAREFVVRGLLEPEGPAKAYGGALAIMDIDGARYSFGKEGKVDRIDIVVDKGADLDAVTRRLQERLGPAYRVERPDAQAKSLGKMVESYQALLGFFSLLALLVGIFLVANAVSVAVAERRREIGTLRALGATRLSIVAVFLGEALALGLVGAAAGIALGRALAGGLVASVARSMSVQFVTPIQVSDVRLDAAQAGAGIAVGALAALLAALVPAIRTVQVHPLEALRPPVFDDQDDAGRLSRLSRLAGVGMLVALLVSSRLGLAGKVALFETLDPLFAIGGALLAGPWFVAALVRGLRAGLARWSSSTGSRRSPGEGAPAGESTAPSVGLEGGEQVRGSLDSEAPAPRLYARDGRGAAATVLRLACDNLLRNPKRTGSNVMSLMVGLMLVVVLSTMSASFKDSVSGWFARILQWDLLVSAAGNLAATNVQPLHEEVARELAAVEGVEANAGGTIFAMRFSRTGYAGKQIGLKAFDRPGSPVEYGIFDVKGRPPEEATRELFDSTEPAAMVSENFALHFGKREGDTLELDTPSGKERFRIVAQVTDFASPEGVVYLTRDTYKRLWKEPLVTGFGVRVAPGADVAKVRRELDERFGKSRGFVIASSGELRQDAERSLEEAFAATHAIELAALLVGLLGLLNTLLVSVMERFRELGMLRAIGMSRAQLAGMVFAESAILGVFGALVAALLGAYVSWAWLVGSLSQMIGWVIAFRFPWSAVGLTLLAGIAVAVLAGWLPSKRAAALEIREALDYE